MARPRRKIDYSKLSELASRGLGSRRIARVMNASRSVIQRALAGKGPEHGLPVLRTSSESDRGGGARRRASDRQQAHKRLAIWRDRASDAEFAEAARDLDARLADEPTASSDWIVDDVLRDLKNAIARREDAERLAAEAREQAIKVAKRDLEQRWEQEAQFVLSDAENLELDEDGAVRDRLDKEKARAATLLVRRLSEREDATRFKRLVDKLVEDGIRRARRFLEQADAR